MAERKSFLIRIDPDLLKAVQQWADDDLRSLNGQIEFLLRRSLVDSGRLRGRNKDGHPNRKGDGNADHQPE